MGVARVELAFDLIADVSGKLEVGLADVAADHAVAFRLDLPDARADGEGVFGVDEPNTISEKRHEIPLRGFPPMSAERISTLLLKLLGRV